MDKQFLERQKQLLLKEKERLQKEIASLEKYPDYGNIGDDVVQELTDFETNQSLDQEIGLLLKKVNSALDSIEDGTYGICKKCREEIDKDRLEFMAYADLCVSCKKKND